MKIIQVDDERLLVVNTLGPSAKKFLHIFQLLFRKTLVSEAHEILFCHIIIVIPLT